MFKTMSAVAIILSAYTLIAWKIILKTKSS